MSSGKDENFGTINSVTIRYRDFSGNNSSKKVNMRNLVSQLLLLLFFTSSTQVEKIELNGNTYVLDFFDEFNNTEIDTTKWAFRTDSKHWSTQLKRNVELKNGLLYLNLKKEKSLDKNYTGGGIISLDTFRYGYYETRVKIPEGEGWHTSFWLMKHNRLGNTDPSITEIEIDVFENDSKHPTGYEIAFHKWLGGHISVFGQHVKTANMRIDFVEVACEYNPNYVIYYMNGNEVKNLDISEVPKGSINIWLTSIASHLGGTSSVDDNELPSNVIFDYVKYYKLEE